LAAGVWTPFLIVLFLLGIFLQNYTTAVFALILILIGLLARWWQKHSLDGVTYQRGLIYRRGYPGESLAMRLEVENRKFLPISWLRIEDRVPLAVAPAQESLLQPSHLPDVGLLINHFSLRWYERDRILCNLLLRTRGVYRLGPARLESGDILGIFEQVNPDGPEDYVTVFPKLLPFSALRLPADDPFGERSTRRRLYDDPNLPMGVRDYQPDDDFRRLHWPATARTGELQVKVYQPISARVMVVCLNVSTLSHYWQGTLPEMLEYMVSMAATVADYGLRDGYRVGLISNGSLAHADQPFRIAPGRSPDQLTHLLTALASVTMFATTRFDRFLLTQASRLPYGASLVIISSLLNPALVETLFRLKQRGWRITLLYTSKDRPQSIPGVRIVHLPYME
jgi:uncharacterized protein (DUF58 family)